MAPRGAGLLPALQARVMARHRVRAALHLRARRLHLAARAALLARALRRTQRADRPEQAHARLVGSEDEPLTCLKVEEEVAVVEGDADVHDRAKALADAPERRCVHLGRAAVDHDGEVGRRDDAVLVEVRADVLGGGVHLQSHPEEEGDDDGGSHELDRAVRVCRALRVVDRGLGQQVVGVLPVEVDH